MKSAYPLPDGKKIEQLLEVLFDGLEVKPGGVFDPKPAAGAWVGVFVADDGSPVALCGTDAALSAGFGAALSLLPVASVKEAVAARLLAPVMIENMREVMNICSRLVMDTTSPHLKLEALYPIAALPPGAAALLANPQGRCVFQVSLQKYGGGVLIVATA